MGLSDTDVKEIKEANDKVMKSFMALDSGRFSEMCSSDAIMVSHDAKIFQAQGETSLKNWFDESMSEFEPFEFEYDIHDISGDEKSAYILCSSKVNPEIPGSDEMPEPETDACLSVFEKQDDYSWKMKLHMYCIADKK